MRPNEEDRDYYDPPELELVDDPADVDDIDYIRAAKGLYEDPALLQVDPDAEVSIADSGAWVQAWVYVDLDDLPHGLDLDPEEL